MPKITIRDPGGPYVAGFTEAFYAPFTAATGIAVERVVGGVEPTGLIQDMVATRDYRWDMALVSHAAHLQLAEAGALELLGEPTPPIATIPQSLRSPYFIGNEVLAMVLAVSLRAWPDGGPENWTDLWDVTRFPGRRALRAHPIDTLEMALLADGVAPDALYPLDVECAFRSLDRIRPHVAEWWPRVIRTQELMAGHGAELIVTSSIRAQAAIDAGADYRIAWGRNLRSCEGFLVLRGTPNADACRAFIRFAATPERQAAFTTHVCAAPTIPAAHALVPPGRARLLPSHPAHASQAVSIDSAFWSRAKDSLQQRFMDWLK